MMNQTTMPTLSDHVIDMTDADQLNYIAAKLGCSIDDIILAVETIKSNKRQAVYTWLIDYSFQQRMHK